MNLRLKDVMSLRTPSTSKVYSNSLNTAAASPSCHLPFRRAQGEKSHHSVFPARRGHAARAQDRDTNRLWIFFSPGVADCSRAGGHAAGREHPLLHHAAAFRDPFLVQRRCGV